jgi:hypothetical protein
VRSPKEPLIKVGHGFGRDNKLRKINAALAAEGRLRDLIRASLSHFFKSLLKRRTEGALEVLSPLTFVVGYQTLQRP